jgi:dynein heavy chain
MNGSFTPFLQKEFDGLSCVPLSAESNPLNILTTEAEMARWNSDALPADRVSMENGAIVCNSARWPLVIDPQLQGIKWLRNKEADPERHLEVCPPPHWPLALRACSSLCITAAHRRWSGCRKRTCCAS